jgi:hypothetical protein
LSDCRASSGPVSTAVGSAEVIIVSANYLGYIDRSNQFLDAFYSTVEGLVKKGKLVILIGKIPIIDGFDRKCAEKSLGYPLLSCRHDAVPVNTAVTNVNRLLEKFAQQTENVEYFDINSYICSGDLCSAFDTTGIPLYFDSEHLSLPASWKIGERVLQTEGVPTPFSRITEWLKMRQQPPPSPT